MISAPRGWGRLERSIQGPALTATVPALHAASLDLSGKECLVKEEDSMALEEVGL
jgi:hypothetical protein